MAFEKSVLSIIAYCLLSDLRYLYSFYHSRAARAWSFCNEMYHNVFWYEYLTFQTQIYLHKQYIFDTNIIQSEYALLFPFSIYYGSFSYLYDSVLIRGQKKDSIKQFDIPLKHDDQNGKTQSNVKHNGCWSKINQLTCFNRFTGATSTPHSTAVQ